MDITAIDRAARNTAQRTGDLLLLKQSTAVELNQDYKDFVTDADLMAEEMILKSLRQSFPDIPAYAEESGGDRKTKGPLWVIDPIDGTVNYFRQDDHWSVSIAFVFNGKTQAGVVYLPKKQLLLAENTGHGSKRTVSARSDIRTAQFWVDWPKDDPRQTLDILARLKERTMYPEMRLCSTASMAAVALGRIEGYVHTSPDPFDFAAIALIIECRGGRVTELDGSPWHAFSKSIVASNGVLHDQLLEVVNG